MSLSKIIHHAREELTKVVNGFKLIYKESRILVRLREAQYDGRYISFTETQKIYRITSDLIKFIPFSAFLIVPGGEVLIPPYLWLFPNAIPSQFGSDAYQDSVLNQRSKEMADAAAKLQTCFKSKLDTFIESNDVKLKAKFPEYTIADLKDKARSMLELMNDTPPDLIKIKNFLPYIDLFNTIFSIDKLSGDELYLILLVCNRKPVRGSHIAGLLLKLFRMKVDVNQYYLFQLIAKRILKVQLISHYNYLMYTDHKIITERGLKWTKNDYIDACLYRGIDPTLSKPRQMYYINEFTNISDFKTIPLLLTIYAKTFKLIINPDKTLYKTYTATTFESVQKLNELSNSILKYEKTLEKKLINTRFSKRGSGKMGVAKVDTEDLSKVITCIDELNSYIENEVCIQKDINEIRHNINHVKEKYNILVSRYDFNNYSEDINKNIQNVSTL